MFVWWRIKGRVKKKSRKTHRVFEKLSLKDKDFKIYEGAANDNDLNSWYESLKQIDPKIDELKEKTDVSKFPEFKKTHYPPEPNSSKCSNLMIWIVNQKWKSFHWCSSWSSDILTESFSEV